MKLILTCEHGGNSIPIEFFEHFKKHQSVLNSHRGLDIGSLDLFHSLKPLSDFSLYSEISRLLIELNRSLHHNALFSEFSKNLSKADKEKLINSYYLDYRNNVENQIRNYININEHVLHISVHSFTPILNNNLRNCDIGLLYDSRLSSEKQWSKNLKLSILKSNPNYNIRFNYPYLGKVDGFTTYLRRQFPSNYLGIELEVNQKFANANMMSSRIKRDLFSAIHLTLNKEHP